MTRGGLCQYILRKLGHPVIANIELSSEQLDDIITEAYDTFIENKQ